MQKAIGDVIYFDKGFYQGAIMVAENYTHGGKAIECTILQDEGCLRAGDYAIIADYEGEVVANLISIQHSTPFQIQNHSWMENFPPPEYIVGRMTAPFSVPEERHKCNCETFQVVHFGCKCGGV